MIDVTVTVGGAYGVWLIWTSVALGWSGLTPGPRGLPKQLSRIRLPSAEVIAVTVGTTVLGGTASYALFGGLIPTGIASVLAAGAPLAAQRSRTERRRAEALDAWPRMLEQLRIEVGSIGRSIPQAVVEVGRRAPLELRPAFAAAEREWRRSASADRMLETLAVQLADPTADVVCETLLVAIEVGGSDLDGRLSALIEDRTADLRHRKDARARQSGVRFARRFVLAVPVGMAVAGLSIGTGREAYGSTSGQVLVAVGLFGIAVCWIWAGRYLELPAERRLSTSSRP